MPERLLKQLKKLENFEPSQEWQLATRDFLVNKVKRDSLTLQKPWYYHWQILWLGWQEKLMPIATLAASIVLVLGLAGGASLAAKAEYVPGTTLYSVKEFLQNFEIALATSPQKKTEVYLKLVKERRDDVIKLTNEEQADPGVKEKNLATLVTKMQQDLSGVNASLSITDQQADTNTSTVQDLAKKVTENLKETKAVLAEVQKGSESSVVTDAVTDAIAESEKVGTNANNLIEKQKTKDIQEQALKEETNPASSTDEVLEQPAGQGEVKGVQEEKPSSTQATTPLKVIN